MAADMFYYQTDGVGAIGKFKTIGSGHAVEFVGINSRKSEIGYLFRNSAMLVSCHSEQQHTTRENGKK